MKHALVVINGDIQDYSFYKPILQSVDHVVVVDGGSRYIEPLGLKPDVLLGDFDSIEGFSAFIDAYPDLEIIQFPARKNFTDSELAVEYVISKMPEKVTLIGCLGSRMDHTFSTVLLLKKFLDAGIDALMVNEKNEIRLTDQSIELKGKPGDLLSIVPVTYEVTGINLYGLEYPLNDATLTLGSSTGISNIFASESVKIELSRGVLLVFKSID